MAQEKPEKSNPETEPNKEDEKIHQELEALRDKLLRNAADYDNARKRLQKEREEFIKFSQERLLRELLPILDNFERALPHLEESGPDAKDSLKALTTGIQMISKQLLKVLAGHGLNRFSSVGEPFDPHRHEAVDQVEEEGPEDVVIKEILPGYLLHERVLRPAKVEIRVRPGKIGSKPAEEKEEEIT
ncbi:MAG: nucleotide exchange factor GrpE [Candidatus Omnitrophica bacterium]|nr:nucleotide exchange factor GrpE [Candidatus Omnitrophota bacterium]